MGHYVASPRAACLTWALTWLDPGFWWRSGGPTGSRRLSASYPPAYYRHWATVGIPWRRACGRLIRLCWLAIGLGLALAPVVRADEAEDDYTVAAVQYQRKQWKFAAEGFEVFLKRHPDHARANQSRFFLAETLLQLGRIEEATARFKEYLDRDSTGQYARPALFRWGESAYLLGKNEQAKPLLEQFLAKYPDDKLDAYVLPYLGNLALGAKDVAGAERYFRQGLKQYPRGHLQDDCRFGLAEALERQGNRDEAERLYLAVAAKTSSPLAEDAQFHLGSLQYAMGKFEEAISTFDAFETRLAQSRWRSTVRLGRGWALVKLNRLAEAVPVFTSIVADPQVGLQARYWLGLTQKSQKDYAAAAKTLLAAAAQDPKSPLAATIRFHAGDALLRAGDIAGAADQFDEAMAAAGTDDSLAADALHGKAQAALKARDEATLDRVTADFAKRFPNSPLAVDVRRISARSLLERKQFAPAAEILKPMVAAEPDGMGEQELEDRYLLSLAYEGMGRRQDAMELLAPVLIAPSGQLQANARLAQGSLLVALNRHAEAIPSLEAFLATQPAGEPAIKCLGELSICYAKTKQMDKAKKFYGELIQKHPASEVIVPVTAQMADAAFEAGELEWSRRLFEWLNQSAPSRDVEANSLAGVGWTQFKAGQWKAAAASFAQVLQKNPPPALAAEMALVRGKALEKLSTFDGALAMYGLVIDKYPQSVQMPEALWAAAQVHDRLKQAQAAAPLYERLSKEYPRFPKIDEVLYWWAWDLGDLGHKEQSTAAFQRILKEHPESDLVWDATYRLASRAYDQHDNSRAKELIGAVLQGKPKADIRKNSLYLAGQIAMEQQKYDESRQAFAALLAEFPDGDCRAEAEFGVAEAYYRQQRFDEAISRLQPLVEETAAHGEPWMASIHLRLAQSLSVKKRWNEAYQAASRIQRQFPGFVAQYEADYVMGWSLANQAEFEQARDSYHKVLRNPAAERTETAAKAQCMIAETFYHQKNWQEALREYMKVEILYKFPYWQSISLIQAAKCHEALGERKEAIALYQQVVEKYSKAEPEQAAEAAKLLDAARQPMAGN
jgi:TolA-binding protein